MEQKQRKFNIKEFFKNQGLYVALVLCLLVVGAAVLLIALPSEDEQQAEQPNGQVVVEAGQSEDETLNEAVNKNSQPPATLKPTQTPTPLPSVSPQVSPSPSPAPSTKTTTSTSKADPPVNGEIVWGFATDKLIYSKTLDQWMTHEGVDIAAELGTEVKAVLSGTVLQVYEDDALGYTVIVEHTSDRLTLYANLSDSIPVKVGDRVNAGTVIGTVGSSAISECAEVPHLHFAFYVGGSAKDPADYVKLG
ncbi:MAG: M23 family metallopeptidase [Clostridia bacterium]|nr:M23 family metallopeptidase [Clostridia bacterium]